MSIECPNGCESMPRSCPIEVEDDQYVEHQAEQFKDRKGVSSTTGNVTSQGNPRIVLEIDQSEYSTENHFKHRDTFENTPTAEVNDMGEGTVELKLLKSDNIITAMECPECGTIYESQNGVVFEDPTKKY